MFIFSCRVFCVKYSCDATYVISGSDDTNLRLWKAKASEQLGVVRICAFSCYISIRFLYTKWNQKVGKNKSIIKHLIVIYIYTCILKTLQLWRVNSHMLIWCAVLQILPREQKKHEYNEAVKNRYKHLPEIKRIVRYTTSKKKGCVIHMFLNFGDNNN